MNVRTFYWQIVSRGVGFYNLEIWSKNDKSDKITEKFVILDDDRIRYRIEEKFNKRNVQLIHVKKK